MATWGQTNTTNASNSAVISSTFRMMGGTSPNLSGMTLTSVSLDFSGSGQTVRVAVYTGGAADNPVGATLVEDLGTLVINGSRQFFTVNSATNPALPQNALLWIAVKQGASGVTAYWSTSSTDAGDFQTARGRDNHTGQTNGNDPATAFPSTLDGTASFSSAWYPWYLTYSTSGGSTQRRRTILRAPKNTQRAFKPQSRLLFGATKVAVALPDDYYLPRNPTVRHGPTITATAAVAPTLNPTVTRIR